MIERFKGIYFLSVFLILAPPIFILNPALNTHRLAGILWLFLSLTVLLGSIKKGGKTKVEKKLLFFFLFYIAVRSLSILGAQNIEAFLGTYEDFIFPAILFILSLHFIKTSKDIERIISILFSIVVLNVALQTIAFLNPSLLISFGGIFIHPEYLRIAEVNLFRGRIFIENYDETLTPVISYFLIKDRVRKFPFLILLVSIVFFSFFSGFRTKFLMLIFALSGSAAVFRKYLPRLSLGFILILVLFFLVYSIPFSGRNYTVFDRLFLDEAGDLSTVTTGRIDRWGKAIEMGLSSPVFGVGLGNYFDHLEYSDQRSFSLFKEVRDQFSIAARDPHDVFFSTLAETGFLGFSSLILLLLFFLQKDIAIIKRGEGLSKAFVLSFWTLFVFALLNPSTSIVYQALFWTLRVMIEKSSEISLSRSSLV